MARDHSYFLEKFMLLRRSEPPILSGSTKKLRSSSAKWFLGVIIGSCCCLTFFSFSSIFFNASGVVLGTKLNFFSNYIFVAGLCILR